MTNGLSHPYHLDESTFILEFLFLFHYSMNFFKANIASLNRQRNIYKLVKLGQTETLPGQTVVEPPFSGYKRGFTGSNRVNPCHHRCEPWRYHSSSGLYRPNTGAYRGSASRTVSGCSRNVPVSPRRHPGGDRVALGVVPVFPRCLTAFPINILKQPWT